ncbi:MAG: ABC transporter ATP-binding protein [Paracoccaceae bacterium]|nr:ABC transporter ATP-binding protein [Paracoccaceae bacterium]
MTLDGLGATLGGREVLRDISLGIDKGEVVGLLGPNGAGKTTLLRAALGLIPATGQASLAAMTPRDRARTVGFLPQSREIAWPMSVERIVALGRLPHLPPGARPEGPDAAAIDRALAAMDLAGARDRTATRLSGGEQARVLLARVLAQETPLILADEPVSGLDPAHQIATMEAFGQLAATGHGILASLHDLALAHRWCDRVVLMNAGRIVADGPPVSVLDRERLRAVFGVEAGLVETDAGPALQILGRAS